LQSGLQELDETSYWLELLSEAGIVKPEMLDELMNENDQLIRIFVAACKNAKP